MNPVPPVPDSSATTDVPLLAGRYQLLDKLGQGGMGTVYRARDVKLDRHVAIKILPTDSVHDTEAVARFQREAKALARLSHPGIIQAFDSGEDGDKHFLVMELFEGLSLARELADTGRIAPTRAADYAHQAALALCHAHQNGLIHRDVKPSNLLRTTDGRVKLLDLGLARFLQDQIGDTNLTREGSGMGTPDYAPPEQFRDAHHADLRSDVYSLGCTLYHLLAGRVPFPGSSMSEKVRAHETKEPPPLDEVCPDMPGGLALVVERMMAKRPADRFQSMAEVAEALAPYVASSSRSFRAIRSSSTWDGSRLATMPAVSRRRAMVAWLVAGLAAALVLVAIGIVGFAAGWFRSEEPAVAQATHPTLTETGKEIQPSDTGNGKIEDPPKKETPKKKEPRPGVDPNLLTVSKEPKHDALFANIADALKAVKPGQTIRILDDATYDDEVAFNDSDRHKGVALEATGGATLSLPAPIRIENVGGVNLRSLRIRAARADIEPHLVVVTRNCPGTVLDGLDIESKSSVTGCIDLWGLTYAAGDEPVSVQNCSLRGGPEGVRITGFQASNARIALSCGGIVVRNNRLVNNQRGILLFGQVHHVQVVGNRIESAFMSGIMLNNMLPESEDITIANNTVWKCQNAFLLWDGAPNGKNVSVRNNLFLEPSGPDMLYIDAGNKSLALNGPGDQATLHRLWRVEHNWREAKMPVGTSGQAKSWIVPDDKRGDVRQDKIDGVERDPKSPDFLRPGPKTPLALVGAGNEDPSLPPYVGALPPEGTEPWDWERAWRMPKDAQLLTVSKDSKPTARYASIGAALKAAKSRDTIRVLDNATYAEAIALDDPKAFAGLTLEAPRHATLHLTGKMSRSITIRDVPDVRISGFRFIDDGGSPRDITRAFIQIGGDSPGTVLHELQLTATLPVMGIIVRGVDVGAAGDPVRVERCSIRSTAESPNDGLLVTGGEAAPTTGIIVRDNRVMGTLRGIALVGSVDRACIVGNVLGNCKPQAGVDLSNLSSSARRLLVANNTMCGCTIGIRFCEVRTDGKYDGGGEIANNLILDASASDIAYIACASPEGGKPGDAATLRSAWRWVRNARDHSGSVQEYVLKLNPEEGRKVEHGELTPFDLETGKYPRPVKGTSLAVKGSGENDPSLPIYIGALPPEDVAAWNWDRTWRARVKKTDDKK